MTAAEHASPLHDIQGIIRSYGAPIGASHEEYLVHWAAWHRRVAREVRRFSERHDGALCGACESALRTLMAIVAVDQDRIARELLDNVAPSAAPEPPPPTITVV